MNAEQLKAYLSIDLTMWNELACLLEKHPDVNLHAKGIPWNSRDIYTLEQPGYLCPPGALAQPLQRPHRGLLPGGKDPGPSGRTDEDERYLAARR